MLLPLLASVVVATAGSHADVERTFSDGVRARVAAGWTVADMRSENDGFVATLVAGEQIERHVMEFTGKAEYRIESDAKLPQEAVEPSDWTLQALTSPRGGIEISSGCGGEYFEVPYMVESFATEAMAPRFVAATLATADDLTQAHVYSNKATFKIERGDRELTLLVWLDNRGNVIEAQLRSYGGANDGTASYNKSRQLSQALRHGKVARITDANGVTLVTSKSSFPIDPDGDAFASNDEEYEGCGC